MSITYSSAAPSQIYGTLNPTIERRDDGSMIVRTRELPPYPKSINERLHHWAKERPDHVWLGQRGANLVWRRLTYREAQKKVRAIAAALLKRNLSPDRPILVLSGNSIEHALIGMAAMEIGVPYCPLSTAYSLVSKDFGKLRYALELLTPGLVFASEGKMFANAIKTTVPEGVEVVVADGSHGELGVTSFQSLLDTPVGPEVQAAYDKVGPETICKFLLTSGSTGMPKAVINTQRMMCANQVMMHETLAFMKEQPQVMVDWLPWSHTFGGNHNFNIAVYGGGSFYIDEGKPLPGAIDATVRNLRDISPTIYFNVPKGYETLLPYFDKDEEFRRHFFQNLNLLFYAGAGLARPIWDALREYGLHTAGRPVAMTTSLGSTETAPSALTCTFDAETPGIVGLPMPGVELKLVPNAGKLEARLRGPTITAGYWRSPDLTNGAFDEEGFYKLGDALKFLDPSDLDKGFVFDGRVSEDFKLMSGTWVSVGPLRISFLAHFHPLAKDVVIAGHDRDDLTVLVFPDFDACKAFCTNCEGKDATPEQIAADPGVRGAFRDRLISLAKQATGSANKIVRAQLLIDLPSIDLGEATDKGSLNQRAVLANRAHLVEELYAPVLSPNVITIESRT